MKKYAIFFPQFHPIEANDRAWGHGFTDWALVAVANAFDYWHRRAPAAGFYNLSEPSVMRERIEAAAGAGLDGFGIYHYRFDDGPELKVVEEYLQKSPELPKHFGYFLIWANESWSRRWAGQDTDLIKRINDEPSREDVRAHVEYLSPFFGSENYTRLDGRPVFVIYRPESFRDPDKTIRLYREEFRRVGHDPSIGYFLKSHSDAEYSSIFDFCYFFEPRLYFNFYGALSGGFVTSIHKWLIRSVSYSKVEALSAFVGRVVRGRSRSYKFSDFLKYFKSLERLSLLERCSCPVQNVLACGWNNAPRYRSNFTELTTPNAQEFSSMLAAAVNSAAYSRDVPLLINAWNEWSEGAAVEECSYLGTSLLNWYLS